MEWQRGVKGMQGGGKMEGCGDGGRRESDECDSRDRMVIEKQVSALGGN